MASSSRNSGSGVSGSRVPHTSRATGRPGSSRRTSRAARTTWSCWPCAAPLNASSLTRFQASTLGCARALRTSSRTRRSARSRAAGVSAAHRPGTSNGATPCQTRMPAASSRSSRAGLSACCARVALAPIRCSRAITASISSGDIASPCPAASSWIAAPSSSSRRPFRNRRCPRVRTSRSPTRATYSALAGDRDPERVQLAATGPPQVAAFERRTGADPRGAPGGRAGRRGSGAARPRACPSARASVPSRGCGPGS